VSEKKGERKLTGGELLQQHPVSTGKRKKITQKTARRWVGRKGPKGKKVDPPRNRGKGELDA